MIANQNYKAFTRYDSASSVHFVSNRLVSKTGRKETLLSCEYSKIKSCSANSHSLVGTYSGNSSGCRQSDQPKILSLNLPKPSWWVLPSQLSICNTFKRGSIFQMGLPLQNLNCTDSPDDLQKSVHLLKVMLRVLRACLLKWVLVWHIEVTSVENWNGSRHAKKSTN